MNRPRSSRSLFVIVAVLVQVWVVFGVGGSFAAAEEVPEPVDALVNNVFVETFLTDALRDISLQTGVPILTDTTVSGFISVDLLDVPLPEALNQVLLPAGYTVRWMDGYYLVGSARSDSPIFHLLTVTKRVKLSHAKADQVRLMLATPFAERVRSDLSTNSVIVTGPPDIVSRIVADIKTLDKPPYQVRMDVLVTEINEAGRKELGLDWSWTKNTSPVPPFGSGIEFTDLVGSIGYSLTGGLERFFLKLRQQVEAGNAEIRSNPTVVALEGEEASIFVGTTAYYRIVSGRESDPVVRLEAIEAGVSLIVKARVSDDGVIVLEAAPSVSDVQGSLQELPVIGRRRMETTVRVRDGETLGLGGLLQETEAEVVTKVPLLGDLPIFGALFRSTRKQSDETEVLIFITPHVLRDGETGVLSDALVGEPADIS